MEIKTFDYYDLLESQLNELERLSNDTLPQGQTFFYAEGEGEIIAIDNNQLALFKAQNIEELNNGSICLIVQEWSAQNAEEVA